MTPSAQRLASLDQFRGYTVAGMVLVNFLGGLGVCPEVLKHHHTYFSYADSIMPQFLFAAGFAFRLVWTRQVQRYGVAAAARRAARRLMGLLLLALVWHTASPALTSWNQLVEGGAQQALYESFKRHWFNTLTHIAVTSLWILPVLAAPAWARVAWMAASAAAHVALSGWFNFHWIYENPLSIDGGPLGFLSWSLPAIVGTLACDAVAGRAAAAAPLGRLFAWALALMALGYGLSCMTRWYDVPAGTSDAAPQLAAGPVWPQNAGAVKHRLGDYLAEPPFVPPPESAHRQWNYWMMGQRPLGISYTSFAAGLSLALYALAVWLCDRRGWRLGVFQTLGTNALAAYLIHDVVAAAIGRFLPGDSPAWYGLSMFALDAAVVYLFVRHLEKNDIYLRL